MHTTTPTDEQMLAAFNGCEKVIDGLHAVLDLAALSTYDQQAMDLCNVCGWKGIFPGEDCLVCKMAAPSTRHMEEQPDGTLIEVQPQAAPNTGPEPQSQFGSSDLQALILANLTRQAAPSTSLPFAPWSKEAEMMEAWSAPSASLATENAALRAGVDISTLCAPKEPT